MKIKPEKMRPRGTDGIVEFETGNIIYLILDEERPFGPLMYVINLICK